MFCARKHTQKMFFDCVIGGTVQIAAGLQPVCRHAVAYGTLASRGGYLKGILYEWYLYFVISGLHCIS